MFRNDLSVIHATIAAGVDELAHERALAGGKIEFHLFLVWRDATINTRFMHESPVEVDLHAIITSHGEFYLAWGRRAQLAADIFGTHSLSEYYRLGFEYARRMSPRVAVVGSLEVKRASNFWSKHRVVGFCARVSGKGTNDIPIGVSDGHAGHRLIGGASKMKRKATRTVLLIDGVESQRDAQIGAAFVAKRCVGEKHSDAVITVFVRR